MCIMSKIATGIHCSDTTRRSKVKKQKARAFHKTDYFHHGYKICRDMFKKIHGIGETRLNNLMRQYLTIGIEARVHGNRNRLPSHAIKFDDIKRITDFILNYAEVHAITLPGRTPRHWRTDVRLLPTNCTKKTVYNAYKPVVENQGLVCVSLRSFRRIWRQLLPFISTMRPATDLCWRCQKNSGALAYI